MLCCEISHKVMRRQKVLEIIKECVRQGGNHQDAVKRKLIGSTVLTDYNNATYKINDIDWDQSPSSTFPTKNGPVMFSDYYRNKYNLNIRDQKQPLLVSKSSARSVRGGQSEFILLVPELCRATGITDEMRNNFQLMRDMSDRTRLTPRDRIDRLTTFNRRLHDTEASALVMRENRMQLSRQLVEFEGRRLEQEIIEFGGDNLVNLANPSTNDSADWTQALANNRMFNAKSLQNWYYVYPSSTQRSARSFLTVFTRAAEGLGMRISAPIDTVINDDRSPTYISALQDILRKDPMFIMVVVKKNRADLYAAIKRETLCRQNPVSVQVMCERTMAPTRGTVLSIATKVAIQVNCKIGGIPWMVDLKLSGIMIVGFDVSHDTRSKRHSYGAMVASLNPKEGGGHYFSAINQHESGEQLSQHFGNNLCAAIRTYCDHNEGFLPQKILIYRDGVGDGQVSWISKMFSNYYLYFR